MLATASESGPDDPRRPSIVQQLQSVSGSPFDGPITVGRCDGVCLGEMVPSLLDVARSLAFGEHRSPQMVGPRSDELGTYSTAVGGGLGKVGVRLVVTPEDGGKATKVKADRSLKRDRGLGTTASPTAQVGPTTDRRRLGAHIRWQRLPSQPL